MFQPAFERILANTTRASVESVVYPARLDQNVTSAAQNLQRLIKDALQDCPDQKYILFGYSQGATLILSALPGLSCEVDAIASIVRVGNPNRIPGRLSSVDRVGNRDFRHEYGRYAIEAMNQNETILQVSPTLDMSGRVKDICVENDGICAADPDCQCPIMIDHMAYGMSKDAGEVMFKHVLEYMH